MSKEIDVDTLNDSNEQIDINTPDDSKKRVLKIGIFAILVFIVILIGFIIVFFVMNATFTHPPKPKVSKSTPSATAIPARVSAPAPISTSKQTVAPAVTESSAPKEHLNTDIKLQSNDNNGYFKRGYAYYALSQYELAIKDYNEAIRLKPDEVDEYNNRGVAYAYLKQYNKAQEDFDKAIRLKPDDPSAYYNYACMFALQKDFAQSCKWLQQAMEKGYKDWKHVNEDKDFDNIRNSSCFIDILKKYGK
jgi:tetratricopeptide (TPR) repeat protein